MKYIFLFSSLLLYSCNNAIDLPNIDEGGWQRDLNGCAEIRLGMIDGINKDRNLLKGLNQDEIISVLGKPDQNELYKRNQKFFVYNISPTGCSQKVDLSTRKYLSIRFNATGLAKEVVIYEE